MKDSIRDRIEKIKSAGDDYGILRKHLCPFFEKGGHPDCVICSKSEADLDECKDYYLERITLVPMDLWNSDFDKFIAQKRETVNIEDITGIGVNCDCCYMSEKCPLYKKGYICGINWGSNKPKNTQEFMDFLINTQYERVKRASVFEKIDGGVPDAGLSGEMDRLTELLNTRDSMGRDKLSISVEASGPAQSGGGILSRIFGGVSDTSKAIAEKPESRKDIIDVTDAVELPVAEKLGRRRKSNDKS